jgi:hypothetical protein
MELSSHWDFSAKLKVDGGLWFLALQWRPCDRRGARRGLSRDDVVTISRAIAVNFARRCVVVAEKSADFSQIKY